MEKPLQIYKNLGETPLEALERVRVEKGIPPEVPMTYAGRLDPMAEGLMVVLVGDTCKQKDAYTGLDKTYEFEVLTGVATDSYDLLGLVVTDVGAQKLLPQNMELFFKNNLGIFEQAYPPFSSKTFEGKQLHQHAREGNLPKVTHQVTLYDSAYLGERMLTGEALLQTIEERIALVHGDFRQTEILHRWREVLENKKTGKFQITKWKVSVSSGFYIRQLVHDLGRFLKTPTVTFQITRIEIKGFTAQ